MVKRWLNPHRRRLYKTLRNASRRVKSPASLPLEWPTTRARKSSTVPSSLSPAYHSVHRFVTLSTLCVGTGTGGSTNMLACALATCCSLTFVDWSLSRRVTIIDFHGHTLMDTYVLPTMPVVDYRTTSTGIEANILNASRFLTWPICSFEHEITMISA